MTSQPFHFPLEEDALELARDRARIEGVVVGVYSVESYRLAQNENVLNEVTNA